MDSYGPVEGRHLDWQSLELCWTPVPLAEPSPPGIRSQEALLSGSDNCRIES